MRLLKTGFWGETRAGSGARLCKISEGKCKGHFEAHERTNLSRYEGGSRETLWIMQSELE